MKDGQTLRSVTYMETVTEDMNGEPMLTADGKSLSPVTVERCRFALFGTDGVEVRGLR